jgi:hypothetical protein
MMSVHCVWCVVSLNAVFTSDVRPDVAFSLVHGGE